MKTEISKVVANKLVDAMARGEATILNNLFTEDATMIINLPLEKPYGGTFNGRNAIIEGFIQRSMQLVRDGDTLTLTNIIADESKVAMEWTQYDKTSGIPIHNYSVLLELTESSIHYISVHVNT